MCRVLVVDDDRGIREMVRAVLELEGFEVEVADGGTQALSLLLAAREPRVVVMDVMMPGLTGVQVCERLHEARAVAPRHQVALMTASELDRAECPQVRTILRKPFDLDALVRLVAHLARDVEGANPTSDAVGHAGVGQVAVSL